MKRIGQIIDLDIKDTEDLPICFMKFKGRNEQFIIKDYFRPFIIIDKSQIKDLFSKYSENIHRVEKILLKDNLSKNENLYYKCYLNSKETYKKLLSNSKFNLEYPYLSLNQRYFLENKISPFSNISVFIEKDPVDSYFELDEIKSNFDEFKTVSNDFIFVKIFSEKLILVSNEKNVSCFSLYNKSTSIDKISDYFGDIDEVNYNYFENKEKLITSFFKKISNQKFVITLDELFFKKLNYFNKNIIKSKNKLKFNEKSHQIGNSIHLDLISLYKKVFDRKDNIFFKSNLSLKELELMIKHLRFYYDIDIKINSENIIQLIFNFLKQFLPFFKNLVSNFRECFHFFERENILLSFLSIRFFLKKEKLPSFFKNNSNLSSFDNKSNSNNSIFYLLYLKNKKIKKNGDDNLDLGKITKSQIEKIIDFCMNGNIEDDPNDDIKLISSYFDESSDFFYRMSDNFKRFGNSSHLIKLKHFLIKKIIDFNLSPNTLFKINNYSSGFKINNYKISRTDNETIIETKSNSYLIKNKPDTIISNLKEIFFIYEKLSISSNLNIDKKKFFYDYFLQNFLEEYFNLFESKNDLLNVLSILIDHSYINLNSNLDHKNFIGSFFPDLFLYSSHELLNPIKYDKNINQIINKFHGNIFKMTYHLNPIFSGKIIHDEKFTKLKNYNRQRRLTDIFLQQDILILPDKFILLFYLHLDSKHFNEHFNHVLNILLKKYNFNCSLKNQKILI